MRSRAVAHEFGALQLRLMILLWRRGEGSVHDLLNDWATEAPTAVLPRYVTVLTVLRRLEARGYLTHTAVGRQHVFAPTVTKAYIQEATVRELATHLFGGLEGLQAVVHTLMKADMPRAACR